MRRRRPRHRHQPRQAAIIWHPFPSLSDLTAFQWLQLQGNMLDGDVPSLAQMDSLKTLALNDNAFTALPPDFLEGLPMLRSLSMDEQWSIPNTVAGCVALQTLLRKRFSEAVKNGRKQRRRSRELPPTVPPGLHGVAAPPGLQIRQPPPATPPGLQIRRPSPPPPPLDRLRQIQAVAAWIPHAWIHRLLRHRTASAASDHHRLLRHPTTSFARDPLCPRRLPAPHARAAEEEASCKLRRRSRAVEEEASCALVAEEGQAPAAC
ncbi:hypothetical protein HU200_033571 [Digitaria exilis]|uniref:Uncharacterized protein n=1 Tax=Digitaria exilis TaxID=1010633 RepID=A0A835BX40_9POAL|nr:hypothetical protein HU200_033571 [Digitaria exilis]